MDNGTNTRINRSENVWKTKDFPLGESQKMRVNCAFFVNSPRVFSVGKCHFFCRDSDMALTSLCIKRSPQQRWIDNRPIVGFY